MSRVGIVVMGPAGVGKSTFCTSIITYFQSIGRRAHIVNLDPAAEPVQYEFTVDIRDLISVQDVMEEMQMGPNGALIYCFEFLLENLDWLDEAIGDFEDEYLLFDCPGQIELYTHIPIMPTLISHLTKSLSISLCASYLLEGSFVLDKSKYFAGALSAMSAMFLLEIPHINVLSKIDLISNQLNKREMKKYLNPDPSLLDLKDDTNNLNSNPKYHALNKAIVQLVEDFGMIQFLPLDANDPESIEVIVSYLDDITQWSEAQEPKMPRDLIELPEEYNYE